MRVLGIDCGSECTGYGVVDSDGHCYKLVSCGGIRTNARLPLAERLLRIAAELERVVAAFSPEMVAIEDVFFAANAKSALKLGHVRGVAMLAAARAGVAVCEYSPLEVKSSVVGYGRAEKRQVQLMVKSILGLQESPEPQDAADALAIAICHIHRAATQEKIERSRRGGAAAHG